VTITRFACIGILILGVGFPAAVGPLFAHHGSAVSYDTDINKLITMKGTVKEWVWKNPHCFIVYEVTDSSGNVVEWTAETSSTSSMVGEFGWSRTRLKAGDELTISVLRSRAGTPAGLLYKVVAADGKVLIEDRSRLRADQR
jgi:hypothetical protein